MKIGIISDSHDHHANVLKAVEVFNKEKVEHIFHGGDIVSPFTAKAFAGVQGAKFISVFGNNDGEKLFLNSTIEGFGGKIYQECYKGKVGNRRIFMTHRPNVVEEVALSGRYDLIIYGHTHKKDIRNVGDTLIINPGESTDWLSDRSGVVVLDMRTMDLEEISLGG